MPTFTIATSLDDGYGAWEGSTTFPLPGNGSFAARFEDAQLQCEKNFSVGNSEYQHGVGFARWDVSSLTDNYITDATFRAWVTDIFDADSYTFCGEWYIWTPPITSAHWTATPVADAFTGVTFASLTDDAYNDIPLINVDKIPLDGYIGIRFHVETAGTPTGVNAVNFETIDVGTHNAPQLIINQGAAISYAQARPDADNAAGTWTTAPLWSKVDEAVTDDADFIQEIAG